MQEKARGGLTPATAARALASIVDDATRDGLARGVQTQDHPGPLLRDGMGFSTC